MADPLISVVVPTYRRPELLRRCLDSLGAQSLGAQRVEIVAVDDGSGDATEQVLQDAARRLPNLVPLRQDPNQGPAAARNRGVAESSAPLVLFIDDDIALEPTTVETHVRLHDDADDRTGILGRVDWHPALRVTAFMRWLDRSGLQFAYDTWLRPGPVDPPYAAFYTANLSLPRDLLERSGGFDERFPYPAYEDMELAWRLAAEGFRLLYRPEARAFHTRAIDLATFKDRMTMVGESAALLRTVQPDFPVDDQALRAPPLRRRVRWRLRAMAPFARLMGADRFLARHFRAEVLAAYRAGRDRAQARAG